MRGRGGGRTAPAPGSPARGADEPASQLPLAELRRRCRRALYAAARRHAHGSRQQLRAAVRSFLRRNRRDREQLTRALRAVARHSAAALLLLGLAAGARAEFVERERRNPLPARAVDERSAPALVDLDADGDLDLVAGQAYGYAFAYFENVGSASTPFFVRRTGSRDPLDGLTPYERAAPALADLDGDGDLDLVAGFVNPGWQYFENTGSAASPAFVQRLGSANPFDGLYGYFDSTPALADLDADGDLDLVAGGEGGGGFEYYENTEPTLIPPDPGGFVKRTGSQNPLNGLGVGSYSAPAVADLDGDGDLDVVSGNGAGYFALFENTGSASAPAFVQRTGTQNPLAGFSLASSYGKSKPSLADLDGDGDLDLVSGDRRGTFHVFENSGSATAAAFALRSGTASPLQSFDVGADSCLALADLDGDGDRDGVAGNDPGDLAYFENLGSPAAPAFVERTGTRNPLDGFDLNGPFSVRVCPTLGDLDGDGDLDAVVAKAESAFAYLENTGTAASPAFAERTGTQNPLDAFGYANAGPVLADLDGDGDLDLLTGKGDGGFAYLENTGAATSAAFAARTGTQNPLAGVDLGFSAKPTLGDVDADGDLDLVAGEAYGALSYFENTGSATAPAFVQRSGSQDPVAGLTPGFAPAPLLADIDGDGSPELFAGRVTGTFAFFDQPRGIALPVPWWTALGVALGVVSLRGRRREQGRAPRRGPAADPPSRGRPPPAPRADARPGRSCGGRP